MRYFSFTVFGAGIGLLAATVAGAEAPPPPPPPPPVTTSQPAKPVVVPAKPSATGVTAVPSIVVTPETAAVPAPPTNGVLSAYTSYDYLCMSYSLGSLSEILNDAGKNGFELVQFGRLRRDDVVCFRRPQANAARLP